MSLNIEQKRALVTEVNEIARSAQSVVAAEYRGLTVTKLTTLRAQARKSGVYMRVVKNTLARKAVSGTTFECIGPQLKGPLILGFPKEDPGAPRVGSVGGQVRPPKAPAQGRDPAAPRAGTVAAARRAQGADFEVRAHARRAARQAGSHRCCGEGPEGSGRGLTHFSGRFGS